MSTAMFVFFMASAVMVGVLITVTFDMPFTKKDSSAWPPDYEGGFGSGFTDRDHE